MFIRMFALVTAAFLLCAGFAHAEVNRTFMLETEGFEGMTALQREAVLEVNLDDNLEGQITITYWTASRGEAPESRTLTMSTCFREIIRKKNKDGEETAEITSDDIVCEDHHGSKTNFTKHRVELWNTERMLAIFAGQKLLPRVKGDFLIKTEDERHEYDNVWNFHFYLRR